MVYDANQWISYDDAESFAEKRNFMDTRCIGGVMIWAGMHLRKQPSFVCRI